MTLAALTWKQLPTQTVVANATIAQILDAVYTAYTASTYADGTARTAGSGVAWTFSRYQLSSTTEAIYGVPVTNTLNQKVIIAGSASSYTPVMMTNGSYVTNTLFIGLAKNAGNFSSWNGATPFTSGQFSGYAAIFAKNATYGLTIKCYESQDAIIAVMYVGASGWTATFAAGALVDPESADTTNDSESDGKVYVVGASGITGGTNYGVGTHTNTYNMFGNIITTSAAGNAHNKFAAFVPGAATILPLPKIMATGYFANSFQTRGGKNVKIPVLVGWYSAWTDASNAYATHTTFAGRVREAWIFGKSVGGQVLRNAGVDVGYTLSNSNTSIGDSFLLSR